MKIPAQLMHKLKSVIEEIFEANSVKRSSTGLKNENISFGNPMETILEPCFSKGVTYKGGRKKPRQVKSESTNKTAPTEIFQLFYVEYPKHVGRGAAVKALDRALKKTTIEVIVAGAKRYAAECREKNTEARFICLPATWLNQERWSDEEGVVASPDAISERLALFRRSLERATTSGDQDRIKELNALIAKDSKRLDEILHKDCAK